MTDTRLAALEAVAEAARVWCQAKARTDEMHYAMVGALAALDALPAQPAGETVTLAVWRDPEDGDVRIVTPDGVADADYKRMSWTRLGTVALAVTP